MSGVSCYFGVTLSGKTTLALDHLVDDVKRDGKPALVLDCMPAKNLMQYPHCRSVDQVVENLYGLGTHAFYTPKGKDKGEEELDQLFKAVHDAATVQDPANRRRVHVLWDEASLHQTPHHIADNISQALRGWQHNDCTFRIVSQQPADFNGVVFATMPQVYCFRLERGADLERVRDEFNLDPAIISKLHQGQWFPFLRNRFATVKGKTDVDQQRRGAPPDPGADAHAVHAGGVQQPPATVSGPLPQDLGPGGRVPPEDPGRDAGRAPEKP